MLLTLSNLKALQADFVPQLVSNFETAFSVKLTDEAKTIRDVLGQIETKLFQSYTNPTITTLDTAIQEGIKAPDWVPSTSRPDQVRPYVFTTMLTLVLVHTEISTTIPMTSASTSSSQGSGALPQPSTSPLLASVLTHLLTKISSSLLRAFQSRPKYTLPALMQATLDTEFIAQTMSQFVSEEASSIQSEIYLELDRRTNNDARTKLQTELGEMRSILKRLRERTKGEFACFRKMRSATSGSAKAG
jgi:exocyst complex component 2